jgi:peroxiredoxin
MRASSAPEARGFNSKRFGRAAGHAGALALLVLAIASTLRSETSADSLVSQPPLRQLTAAPSIAKPTFTLPDLAGSPLKLEEQRGRVVLMHFFATWCEPCREELASLSRLLQGPLGKRVTVVAVDVAEVPARVRRFLDAAPVSFPVVLDADRAVTQAWDVGVLPTTFVLDPTLKPTLFVEGDLDWSHPEIATALDAVGAGHGE